MNELFFFVMGLIIGACCAAEYLGNKHVAQMRAQAYRCKHADKIHPPLSKDRAPIDPYL